MTSLRIEPGVDSKEARRDRLTINSEWSPVTMGDLPGLKATGTSTGFPRSDVEIIVAVSGHQAWRTLVFTHGNSVEQVEAKDIFVREMFGTASP